MPSSRNCLIGSLILGIVFMILGSIAIYFATSSGKSENDPNDSSTDELLIKSTDGTVASYDRKTKTYTGMKLKESWFGIVSFDPYANETIYYATTEVNSVIKSTNNKIYPDLPKFTADWVKTAIAVDDVTKKVYVVDRIANQIKVVDGNYHYILPLKLREPIDLILAPESGKMFVLEHSRIIMASMDGKDQTVIVDSSNLQAMAVDAHDGVVYFAHDNVIESYDTRSKEQVPITGTSIRAKSLAYKDKVLYFINNKGKSSKSPGKSLDNCRLDDSKCVGQCCDVFSVYKSEKLEQVKIYKREKPKTKNPCEKKNGGCAHLCLLNPSEEGRSCACDQGWTLQSDKKTCVKDT